LNGYLLLWGRPTTAKLHDTSFVTSYEAASVDGAPCHINVHQIQKSGGPQSSTERNETIQCEEKTLIFCSLCVCAWLMTQHRFSKEFFRVNAMLLPHNLPNPQDNVRRAIFSFFVAMMNEADCQDFYLVVKRNRR